MPRSQTRPASPVTLDLQQAWETGHWNPRAHVALALAESRQKHSEHNDTRTGVKWRRVSLFVEPLVGVAPRWGRRTARLSENQRQLGLALGGEAGARLAEHLLMPTSPDTLLRMVCRPGSRTTPRPMPRVLGVDDWAWRRGQRYGTIVVDLERHRVVDLLPALQAALELPWTTSPVEGQINRLKMIKRTMYGRAGFNLLRQRVLEAA